MPDRNGKIFYTSITSLSHISKESRRLEIASDNVYSIFRKTNEMKSDLAWKREWEAKVREKARQEQVRQKQRERQPRAKKRSYDMSL